MAAPSFSADTSDLEPSTRRAPVIGSAGGAARWAPAAACVVGAVYAWAVLGRHWVPHDEGMLGQAAERVLAGELPHRDFDEMYSGGLTFLHAGAFRLFGVDLMVLRLVLWAAFAAWLPIVAWLGRRVAGPLPAAGLVLVAAAFAIPIYPAAMPSWYNLFLATFGVAALLRAEETGRSRWLVVAGLLGGVSCLFKIVGVYFVAGALLALVHREQRVRAPGRGDTTPRGSRAYDAFVIACLLAYLAGVVALVAPRLGTAEAYHFVLPAGLLVGFLCHRQWRGGTSTTGARLATLLGLVLPFLAGVAVPIAAFAAFHASQGALAALVTGTLVTPTQRLSMAALSPPPIWVLGLAIPHALALGLLPRRFAPVMAVPLYAGTALILVALVAMGRRVEAVTAAWFFITPVLPLVVLAAIRALRRTDDGALFLLAAVTGSVTLVQYPYALPTYFAYVAALVWVTMLAVMARQGAGVRVQAGVGLALLAIGALVLVPNHLPVTRLQPAGTPLVQLQGRGGGLRVPARDAETYSALVRLLGEHARGGYTYAAPDAPEVYYLSGLRNPTRELFDFFADTTGRTARTLAALDQYRVTAIVVNRGADFSGRVPAPLAAALEQRYPRAQAVGGFEVRWR